MTHDTQIAELTLRIKDLERGYKEMDRQMLAYKEAWQKSEKKKEEVCASLQEILKKLKYD